MMKKLAVTVFVLSLAGLGCGSDSGTTPRKDAGPEVRSETGGPGPEVQPDVAVTGPEVSLEVQADKPATPDEGVDQTVTPLDVGADRTPAGEVQPTVEVGTPDKPVDPGVDGPGSVDIQPAEAAKPVVDGGAVDGGSVG
jgi:hypothetical protein